ncbi:AAA family ATPase [Methanofollis formosanus]|uniref:AAA family ATPase n=1 Tax=Methanofollis formosanus TaxID=299308 RepID=A0A8G1EFK9_9EURY|nr:AAA family ATPase [Methanofollis formosanus]QYZ78226.1 AAA family ATPase [Methanofollis formosanus]
MTPWYLMADQALFRDPSLFETRHLPEVFNYRDAQLEELAFAFRPTLHGARPLNALLQGPPGTGKTTTVRRIFAEVEETTNQVVPVLVSCQTEKTLFAVLRHIFHVLFGYSPPTSGVSNERLLSGIAQALIEREAVLVVCLDDANWLLPNGMLDIVLGPLLRMHEVWPAVRTGVFLTLSSPETDLSRALDPATRSVLQASEVFFPPYTADEVRGILADRVRAGLYPGVMPPAVLDLVVERVMRRPGPHRAVDVERREGGPDERDGRGRAHGLCRLQAPPYLHGGAVALSTGADGARGDRGRGPGGRAGGLGAGVRPRLPGEGDVLHGVS